MRLNGMAKPKINEYKVNVEPASDEPFECDHNILHVICSDPGNFSVVFAVEEIEDAMD